MQLRRLEVTIKGLFLALGVAGLVSCGSGDDASDNVVSCGGADDSGVCLQVELIDPFNIDAQFTSDVDVNGPIDCDGDITTNDPEPFTEHFAEVTFSAFYIDGNAVQASFVQVTNMTVTFTQNTVDPPVTCGPAVGVPPPPPNSAAPCDDTAGPGPAIATLTTPINVVIPVGTSVTQTLPLVNFQRKDDYTPEPGFDIFTQGPFDPNLTGSFLSYNVRYDFAGEDEFGQNVNAIGFTELTFGAYNNC